MAPDDHDPSFSSLVRADVGPRWLLATAVALVGSWALVVVSAQRPQAEWWHYAVAAPVLVVFAAFGAGPAFARQPSMAHLGLRMMTASLVLPPIVAVILAVGQSAIFAVPSFRASIEVARAANGGRHRVWDEGLWSLTGITVAVTALFGMVLALMVILVLTLPVMVWRKPDELASTSYLSLLPEKLRDGCSRSVVGGLALFIWGLTGYFAFRAGRERPDLWPILKDFGSGSALTRPWIDQVWAASWLVAWLGVVAMAIPCAMVVKARLSPPPS